MRPYIAFFIILTFTYVLFKDNVEKSISNTPISAKIAMVIVLVWVIISLLIQLPIPHL